MPTNTPPRRKRRQGGKGRPWPKGVSPNPHGRKRKELAVRVVEIDVRRYSREQGREAVDTLLEIMRGKVVVDVGTPEEPKPTIVPVGAATRVAAAEALLDRGYGRPPQAVEIAGKDGGPVVTSNSAYDIIRSRLDSIAERLREGEGPPLLN
jgi:hypothetical protein